MQKRGEWNWITDDGTWKAGRDFRAPTCSACHMSAALGVSKTHDVTERLSWELQAPSTVRPADFKAFPAKTDWKNERAKDENGLPPVPFRRVGQFTF